MAWSKEKVVLKWAQEKMEGEGLETEQLKSLQFVKLLKSFSVESSNGTTCSRRCGTKGGIFVFRWEILGHREAEERIR